MPEAEPTEIYKRHTLCCLDSKYLLKHGSLLTTLACNSLSEEPLLPVHKMSTEQCLTNAACLHQSCGAFAFQMLYVR